MSSGFVPGGTIDKPTERDDEWRAAQAEIEAKRLEKEDRDKQHDGKSLYEVLQANKAAKQEAFEEATRLKNQYRALDDDEAEFLDSLQEAARKKEAEVQKDTLEQLDVFRKRQEEAERKALEEDVPESGKEVEAHWTAHGRKRKKGHELLKGIKLKKTVPDATEADKAEKQSDAGDSKTAPKPVIPLKPKAASPLPRPSVPLSLALGYASSDDD